jgi:hypothetical protein
LFYVAALKDVPFGDSVTRFFLKNYRSIKTNETTEILCKFFLDGIYATPCFIIIVLLKYDAAANSDDCRRKLADRPTQPETNS